MKILLAILLMLFPVVSELHDTDSVTTATSTDGTEEIRILSWNIYMLPRMFRNTGQMERVNAIADQLDDAPYDLIVFQEVFDKDVFNSLWEKLREYYPYTSGEPGKKQFYRLSSGLLVLGRIPFRVLDEIYFRSCTGIDCLASKGAVLVEAVKNEKVFQLVGTHLQAMDKERAKDIRRKQYGQIKNELLRPYQKSNVPQLIAGDLNIEKEDSFSYNQMLVTLKSTDGQLDGDHHYSFDGHTNDLVIEKEKDYKALLDYVLVKLNGASLKNIKRKLIQFKMPWQKNMDDLSDHYALEAVIILN